jgi:hypothetical protein
MPVDPNLDASTPDRTLEVQRPQPGEHPVEAWANLDAYQAEVIVLLAYMKLPFLTDQPGEDWAATLLRIKQCELRLVERVSEPQITCPLRVELFDPSSQAVVESRACEGITDAAAALLAMIPLAESYEPTSPISPAAR